MKQAIILAITLVLVGVGCAKTSTLPVNDDYQAYNDQENQQMDGAIDEDGASAEASMDEVTNLEDLTDNEENMEKETYSFPGILPAAEILDKQAVIELPEGRIVIELFPETAPKTVSNFVYLAKKGYYDGLIFHRRVERFVIQGGDPTGTGYGGPGYKFEDELNDDYTYDRGIVAMANSGPNTNGSQFFIMLADNNLDKSYSIFGRVIEGMDLVDEINVGDAMRRIVIEDRE